VLVRGAETLLDRLPGHQLVEDELAGEHHVFFRGQGSSAESRSSILHRTRRTVNVRGRGPMTD
jgi:hypothetical protein